MIVAVFLMENGKIAFYFPILMIAGVITGLLIGIASREVQKRIPPLF
jgi:heptaprenyl diphosphate synthase